MFVGAVGVLLCTMDLGIIRIALPSLGEALGVGPNSIIWIQLVTLIVGVGMTLSVGKAADMYGRKRVFSLGLLIMTVGLGLCSLSQNFEQLLASRFISALGIITAMSTSIAIVTGAFSAEERGKALGIIWAASYMGLLSGPILAGILIDTLGWRSLFYMRLPFAVIDMVLAFLLLRADSPREHKGRFDIAGAGLLFMAVPSLMFVLNRGQHLGWASPPMIILTIVGLILLGLFIKVERKAAQPILELKLFSNRFFSTVSGSHVLLYMATTVVDFTMPFFLIQGLSLPTAEAGLVLITIPAVNMVISPLSGRLSDRWGTRLLCIAGLSLITLGILLLRRFSINTSVPEIIGLFAIISVGMGLFIAPNSSAIMGAISREKLGSAAAMINILRQLGMSMGLAIAGSLFGSSVLLHSTELLSQGVTEEIAKKLSVTQGMQDTLLVALTFLVLGFTVSAIRGRDRPLSDS